MRRNIRLKTKSAPKPSKDTYFFFIKDQGTGAAKVFVILLKLAEIALTTIYALVVGIIAPLSAVYGLDSDIDYSTAAWVWFASSILYIIGLFFSVGGKSKIAAVIHCVAAAGTLVTYSVYKKLLAAHDVNPPTELFMPCLFITAISAAIMLILNIPEWVRRHDEKLNEKAPSILEDRGKK